MTHPGPTLRQVMADLDQLRARADTAFAQVQVQNPQAVVCRPGCDDCCHALFDLSLVEALALALAFAELPRGQRRGVQRQAEKSAALFDEVVARAMAQPDDQRLAVLSQARLACPLLQDGNCLLYRQRPLTCRLYGVPVAIEGTARTCHKARFAPGHTYATVDMGLVQLELERISRLVARLAPSLSPVRRDVARALDLAASHAPLLRSLIQ